MKPAGFLLLFSAGSLPVGWADEPARLVSREISAYIREGLPKFQPPPAKAEGEAAPTEPQTSDPNILVLPKLTVKESRLPSDAADHLMAPKEFKRKMENLYLDEVAKDGELNYLLNSFTIPLLSPSKAERGRAIYQRQEIDRLRRVTGAGRSTNPDNAKKFSQELDNSSTTRPAGGLRK
jgi:hypothetical protein